MAKYKNASLKHRFVDDLPADPIETNGIRQVFKANYSFVNPINFSSSKLIHHSKELMKTLEIEDWDEDFLLGVMSGQIILEGSRPFAMCYGGHQFGHWAGQLGDGRAINLGEIPTPTQAWNLQLKGAGPTPYSRTADGFAVLRSSIREYLCSEAMHHLGVSTTRALSLVLSGEEVLRDVMYDGHPAYEPGAIVCRVSSSFIRFGSFEILAARKDKDTLKQLLDHTIKTHYPQLGAPSKTTYLSFFESVVNRTKAMVLDWQRVGFVHGVMNTDNMSILGETIDYGPYGWLEDYDPGWTPNTSDAQHKRYRFGNQASVALWNLTQLANALFPMIEDVEALTAVLTSFKVSFRADYIQMMLRKIGITTLEEGDENLIGSLTECMYQSKVDMTIFFRTLSAYDGAEAHMKIIQNSSYLTKEAFREKHEAWKNWLEKYEERLQKEGRLPQERQADMNKVNPKYVLRNYMAQLAIEAAEKGDYNLIDELFILLKQPYDEQPDMGKWFAKRPDWAIDKIGSSRLSCSS